MGCEVYWIKLLTNTFDCETMMLIESMPEGDTIIIIWIRMQVLAGKCNADGYLLLANNKPYTDEMLATVFRRPLNTTRLAIAAFLEFGLVEIIDRTYFLPEWEKVQNIKGLEKIREQTRQRVALHRTKPIDVTPFVTLDVTHGNSTETDREKELETTTNNVRELLSGTPFSSITDKKIMEIAKRHGVKKLLLAADISAETWRRKPDDRNNPEGYLNTLCGSALDVPKWYIPHTERIAQAKATRLRNAASAAEKAALNEQEKAETKERNALWGSLSLEQQEKYQSAVQAESSFLELSPNMITASAKLLAWEDSHN